MLLVVALGGNALLRRGQSPDAETQRAGNRCIGEYFSFVEMQTHLAVMMKSFRLEYSATGPLELEPAVNLRSRNALHMTLAQNRVEDQA